MAAAQQSLPTLPPPVVDPPRLVAVPLAPRRVVSDPPVVTVPRVVTTPRVERRTASGALDRTADAAERAGLLATMVLGCVSLVTAIPVAWLWLASQMTESYFHTPGLLYLMLGIGIPASIAAGAMLLARVGARYERLRGTPVRRVPHAWLRSVSDSPRSAAPVTAIDVVSTVVTAAAVLALLAYFVLELSGVTR